MTTTGKPNPNLHRGHDRKSPASRARSLAGLTSGNERHGAYNAAATAPVAARERRRLRSRYPAAAKTTEGADLITAMGLRSSVTERYTAFLDANPGRRPDGHAARELRLLIGGQERALRRLAELEREASVVEPGAALEQYLAHLNATDQADTGGDSGAER